LAAPRPRRRPEQSRRATVGHAQDSRWTILHWRQTVRAGTDPSETGEFGFEGRLVSDAECREPSALDRRALLRGTIVAGLAQVTAPFVIKARGETPLRIGMVDPLTGVYAAVAQNEVAGAKLAVAQSNARAGFSDGKSSFWSRTPPMTSARACRRQTS